MQRWSVCSEAYRSNKSLCSEFKTRKNSGRCNQTNVCTGPRNFPQEIFSFGEKVTHLEAVSGVQQRWLLSLPSGQKDGDLHQLCKRHLFKIIAMADAHGDGLKMRDMSYMIECNQSLWFYSVSIFALHLVELFNIITFSVFLGGGLIFFFSFTCFKNILGMDHRSRVILDANPCAWRVKDLWYIHSFMLGRGWSCRQHLRLLYCGKIVVPSQGQ